MKGGTWKNNFLSLETLINLAIIFKWKINPPITINTKYVAAYFSLKFWFVLSGNTERSEWTYVVPSISFQTFLVQAFKIVVDSCKFSMLLLYILWDDRPIFMISDLNEQLQQESEYTLLKTDCHSWWISKMQSGREYTLEERYAIKFCFKLASVFEWHERFKEGRESVTDDDR